MCGKFIRKIMLMTILGVLFISCKQTERKSVLIEIENSLDDKNKNDVEGKRSLIADLPIKIDSTSNFITFEVWSVNNDEKSKSSYTSRKTYPNNYLRNLIFKHTQTDEINVLTTKKIKIVSYEQLYNVEKEAESVILYQVVDTFPKDKKKLNFRCLYLSTDEGKKFKKISLYKHHLISWKYFPDQKKVFFKTKEDSDKNNEFNNLDKEHMYAVNIEGFEVRELLKEELKIINQ